MKKSFISCRLAAEMGSFRIFGAGGRLGGFEVVKSGCASVRRRGITR
jgi:hypothetical protein